MVSFPLNANWGKLLYKLPGCERKEITLMGVKWYNRFIEQIMPSSRKISVNSYTPKLKWPPCDRTTEALFTILIYCGEGQENKSPPCPQFRAHESTSDLELNVSYANIGNPKAPVMRVFNMEGPCQSPCSDFLLLRLPISPILLPGTWEICFHIQSQRFSTERHSPTFTASGTGLGEDNFSTEWGRRMVLGWLNTLHLFLLSLHCDM